ncbi:MAG: DUF4175 domain-containing protein [Muribaculaceae bacterium]|nr:DUF4175 domain-containing protein [Muribaculaceae bacterium]
MKLKSRRMIMTIILSVLVLAVVAIGMILWLPPAFGRSPRGERLERISASPNYRNGQFHNLEKTPELTSDKSFHRALWEALFDSPADKVTSSLLKAMKTDLGHYR